MHSLAIRPASLATNCMNAVDTNVLIYAHDPRDPVKQNKAAALIASLTDGVLLWQVACEYIAASRKLAPFGLNLQQAYADLKRLRGVWVLALPTWTVLDKTETLMATGNLSFWDAMIVAACMENGIQTLYTEDIDSSTTSLTGVTIINPF
jgi:predicted nucleic acid-binding protein